MASSYELNVHLMAEVKYHTHTHLSKNSGVDKFRDTLIYQYISEIVLFDYYYTLLLYIKTFSRVIIILTTIGQVK